MSNAHSEKSSETSWLDDEKFLDSFKRDISRPAPSWAFQTDDILKEMESVPLFMTKQPDNDDCSGNAYLEALQSLIYDGSPDEIATNFKNHGNESMAEKKYKDAFIFYTRGIEAKPEDEFLLSALFSNRALASIKLGNLGAAGRDAREALKLDSGNLKARLRLVKSLLLLEKFPEARDEFALLPESEKQNPELLDLFRKEKKHQNSALEAPLRTRGLLLVPGCEKSIMSLLQGMAFYPSIHILEESLHFPVVLLYPLANQFDLIEKFCEADSFFSQISTVLEEPPPWDSENVHQIENIDYCFFIDQQEPTTLHQIDLNCTLGSLFGTTITMVDFGLLAFFIVPKGEPAKKFISKFDKIIINGTP
jgi:tetratricopeptide (TPR) repeat protein